MSAVASTLQEAVTFGLSLAIFFGQELANSILCALFFVFAAAKQRRADRQRDKTDDDDLSHGLFLPN